MNSTLTALGGVRVGHATHPDQLTGCTVVLFDKDLPVSYVSLGGAPGTIATENLNNLKEFETRDGLFIAGGSMNGLMADATIRRELIKQGRGHRVGPTIMPVFSGAIVWDLSMGQNQFDPEYGAEALANATSDPVKNGNVGAGTGTSVGKYQWHEKGKKVAAMKAGVGSDRVDVGNGGMICVLSVVNSLGNVISPEGQIIAGNRSDSGSGFLPFDETIDFTTAPKANTTISIVGTNLDLGSREAYERVAVLAAQGHTRAVNPVNTSLDGDTVFVFSTQALGKETVLNEFGRRFETPDWPQFSIDVIGNIAAQAVQDSIYDAVRSAETIDFADGFNAVIPAAKDYK
jgi:L-aminopeptidase/D-esterase-like protein